LVRNATLGLCPYMPSRSSRKQVQIRAKAPRDNDACHRRSPCLIVAVYGGGDGPGRMLDNSREGTIFFNFSDKDGLSGARECLLFPVITKQKWPILIFFLDQMSTEH